MVDSGFAGVCSCGTYKQALEMARKELENANARGECSNWLIIVGLAYTAVGLADLADKLRKAGSNPEEAAGLLNLMTAETLTKLISDQVDFTIKERRNAKAQKQQ